MEFDSFNINFGIALGIANLSFEARFKSPDEPEKAAVLDEALKDQRLLIEHDAGPKVARLVTAVEGDAMTSDDTLTGPPNANLEAPSPAAPLAPDNKETRAETALHQFNADLERYRQLRHPEQGAGPDRAPQEASIPPMEFKTSGLDVIHGDPHRASPADAAEKSRNTLDEQRQGRSSDALAVAFGMLSPEQKQTYEAQIRVAEERGLEVKDSYRRDVAVTIATERPGNFASELESVFARADYAQKESEARAKAATEPAKQADTEIARRSFKESAREGSDQPDKEAPQRTKFRSDLVNTFGKNLITGEPAIAPIRKFVDERKAQTDSRAGAEEKDGKALLTRLNDESSKRNQAEEAASRGIRTEGSKDEVARTRFESAVKARTAAREGVQTDAPDKEQDKGNGRIAARSAFRSFGR